MILPLIDYQNVRKKKAGAFFDKKMFYVQVLYQFILFQLMNPSLSLKIKR